VVAPVESDSAQRAAAHVRAVVLAAPVGVVCGLAAAVFLVALEAVTSLRLRADWLVYALPVAGLALGAFLARFGASVRGGTDLVLDTFHEGGAPIPARMAPLVLGGTLLTHLFGGSAGREGTAVQMGAGLADLLATRLRVAPAVRHGLLAAGLGGGFGAVFGTPLAGAVFAIEVGAVGRYELRVFAPALVAAFVGDAVTRALGVAHTVFPRVEGATLDAALAGRWLLFAAGIALAVVVYVELVHLLKSKLFQRVASLPWRMCAGGVAVVLVWRLFDAGDALGLGVPTIVRAFSDPQLPAQLFALKILLTALTLAAGFVGGEVTPLFFVGATLGNVLAHVLGLPLALAAGVGMAATFAAAANAPLALTIMAVELLGAEVLPHAALVCVVAWLLTGHRGIYGAQRLVRRKDGRRLAQPVPLRALRGDASTAAGRSPR
jgi:H+/Cl- antiporter ClcA